MNENLVGTTLGQYQVLDELGRGGMAVVYKGWQPSLRRYVAIKVMLPHLLNDSEFIQRFQQEAIVAANLNHPNIVTIYEVTQQNGHFFIAMEYVEGRSLEDIVLSEGALSLPRTVNILRQVASALDYAHKRQFVHRDIKPANIIVTGDDHAVVSDFGIAKALEGSGATARLTATGTVLGSPAYMSPEQIIGQGIDYRSDLYSLGIVAYEMLSANAPFGGTTTALMYAQVNTEPPSITELNPGLPPQVESALRRMLAKQPAQRFETASAFVDALEAPAVPAPGKGRTEVMSPAAPPPPAVQSYPQAQQGPQATVRADSGASYPQPQTVPYPDHGTGPHMQPDPAPVGGGVSYGTVTPEEKKSSGLLKTLALGSVALIVIGAIAAYFLFFASNTERLLEDATEYRAEGNYDEAIAAYQDVLEDEPDNIEALRGLGEIYEEQESWDQAADWYARWAEEAPNNVEAHMELGQAYHEAGEDAEALEQFERVVELDPDNFEAHSLICRVLYELERYDEGIQACSDALDMEEAGSLYRDLGGSYYAQGDYESALDAYQEWTNLEPQNAVAYASVGWALLQLQQNEEAAEAFTRALEIEQTDDNYLALYNAYSRMGNYQEALSAAQRWANFNPEGAKAHASVGKALLELDEFEGAVEAFSRALGLEESAEAQRGLGDSFYGLGDYASALSPYQAWADLEPDNAAAHASLGWTLIKLDRNAEAAETFNRALEIEQRDDYYLALWQAHSRSGDHAEALAAGQRWTKFSPENATAHIHVGRSLHKLQRFDEAEEAFTRALELEESGLAYAGLGDSLYAQDEYEPALSAYQRWAELEPENATAHASVGWAYVRMRNCYQARQNFQAALDINPELQSAKDGMDKCR